MLLNDILENFEKYKKEIAFRNIHEYITYEELHIHVKNIYSYILKGKLTNKKIVVYGHKEELMIACFLACSFAGIAYIPIDSYTPIERVNTIIKQVQPDIVFNISDKDNLKYDGEIIHKLKLKEICNNKDINVCLTPKLNENDIYYIIFTSGTTGIPKGVMVSYKNINSFINWYRKIITKNKSVILNQASFSFDLSVADIYLSLSTGSELVVLDKKIQLDFKKMFDFLKNSHAEIAVMTPSFIELLMMDKNYNSNLMNNLNTLYFCGEILTTTTAKKIFERFENVRIINSYGPTECTVAVTSVEITRKMLKQNELPIGNSKENTNIYVVDDNLEVLTEGQVGQLLICGDSVSKGYCNAKSDKFLKFNNELSYLTGDMGYYKDNMLWYKGRKDRQIKYRGYRIELDDIEKNFYKLKYIDKVIVVPELDKEKKVKNITAFVKVNENSEKTSVEIKKDISAYIPGYMRPKVKLINNIILNINGKIDNKVLKEIFDERRNN